MAHTYTSLHYHCVFSTHGRRDLILKDKLPEVHAYMGGIVRNLKGNVLAIGGTSNHAHLLIGLPSAMAPAEAVGKIKANLTGWVHQNITAMSSFRWQEGYGAFAVSCSQIDTVASYILNQPKHHETLTFEQEYLALLKKHNIDYDERYVLD
ncbi:MAG: transposase [Phycisphaerae bacterium]|nr:transposase [Phycisphaerae bacterium]